MKTTNLKFKIIGIAVLAVLLVLAISGIVSAFSKGQSGNTDEITYIDKTTNGNIEITFSEDGELVIENESITKSDVYFAGTESNFLKFRQQRTISSRYKNRDYTNYELELLAYSDSECKNLVRYIISWTNEFEIYQVVELQNAEKGSYMASIKNIWNDEFMNWIRPRAVFYIGLSNSEESDDVNQKALSEFITPGSLYLNNGEYKLEITSEKNLLEVFTIILKSLVISQSSEAEFTDTNVALNLSNFCSVKILNEATGTYQEVTNKVCLYASLFKFSRTQKNKTIFLISELMGDYPGIITGFDGSSSVDIEGLTGYVIKY